MDEIVLALARERAGYLRANQAARVIPVDEQLALRGYCVTAKGDLVPVDKNMTRTDKPKRAPKEQATVKAPERAVDKG